jgi:hypothetical protein
MKHSNCVNLFENLMMHAINISQQKIVNELASIRLQPKSWLTFEITNHHLIQSFVKVSGIKCVENVPCTK